MFWLGLGLGYIIGMAVMLVALAFCRAASIGDDVQHRQALWNRIVELEREIQEYKVAAEDDYIAQTSFEWQGIKTLAGDNPTYKGVTIPKGEWSICSVHNRAYYSDEGCLMCKIVELEHEIADLKQRLGEFEVM